MEFTPDGDSFYRFMSGAVVPRPIGWISTVDEEGNENLAPYSFFNAVSYQDPPAVMFSSGDRTHGHTDTLTNVQATGEFVVNLVPMALAEAMNLTSATLPHDESEFDFGSVERAAATRVRPPLVAGAPVSFECTLFEEVRVGTNTVVFGEVVHIHVDDQVLTDGKLDTTKLDLVGRLAGSEYATIRDRFSMERPD